MRTDLDLKSVKSRADLKSCPYLETTARESSTRHAIFQGFWKLRPRRRKSIEGADVAIRLPINPQQQATMRRRRGQARDDREREREREREEVDWRAREGGTRGTMEKREEGMVVGWRSKGWGVRNARERAEKEREREREREKEREWSVKLGHSAIDAFGRNRTNALPLPLCLSHFHFLFLFLFIVVLVRRSVLAVSGLDPRYPPAALFRARTNRFRNYTPSTVRFVRCRRQRTPTPSPTPPRFTIVWYVYTLTGHDGAAIILCIWLDPLIIHTYIHLSEALTFAYQRDGSAPFDGSASSVFCLSPETSVRPLPLPLPSLSVCLSLFELRA